MFIIGFRVVFLPIFSHVRFSRTLLMFFEDLHRRISVARAPFAKGFVAGDQLDLKLLRLCPSESASVRDVDVNASPQSSHLSSNDLGWPIVEYCSLD